MIDFSDSVIQVYCSQISDDYFKFIKEVVIPGLDGFEGLTLRELKTLMCIHHSDDPITGAIISHTMRYDPATVTRATNCLIEAQLIKSSANLDDYRSKVYVLTDKGLRMAAQYKSLFLSAFSKLDKENDSEVTAEEKKRYLSTLLKLRERSNLMARAAQRSRKKRPQ